MSKVMEASDRDALLAEVVPIARSVCSIQEVDPIAISIGRIGNMDHYVISGLTNEWAQVVLLVWEDDTTTRVDVFRPELSSQGLSHCKAVRERVR